MFMYVHADGARHENALTITFARKLSRAFLVVGGCMYISWCCAVSLRCCTETEFELQVVVSCTALFHLADLLAILLRSAGNLRAVIGRLARKETKGPCELKVVMLAANH